MYNVHMFMYMYVYICTYNEMNRPIKIELNNYNHRMFIMTDKIKYFSV